MELGHLRDDGMFEYKGRVYDRKGYIKIREEEIFKTDKIFGNGSLEPYQTGNDKNTEALSNHDSQGSKTRFKKTGNNTGARLVNYFKEEMSLVHYAMYFGVGGFFTILLANGIYLNLCGCYSVR